MDAGLRLRQEIHAHHAVGQPLDEVVDAALALAGGEDLLDVGTGSGDFPVRLLASGHRGRVVGVDRSPGAIAEARQSHPAVDFLVADATSLPFPDGSFDYLTARHVLLHLPDIPEALGEMQRVLRPGGRFAAVSNAEGNMAEFWEAVREALPQPDFAPLFAPGPGGMGDEEVAALVRASFGNASLSYLEGQLAFRSAEAPLRYLNSLRSHYPVPDLTWSAGMEGARAVFAERARSAAWRVMRRVVLIRARKV